MNLASTYSACYQTSTLHGGTCDRALDGNWSGYYNDQSVTHTHWHHTPWWLVDLGRFGEIKHVVFAGREDCCTNQLKNIKIEIMESLIGPVVAENSFHTSVIDRHRLKIDSYSMSFSESSE